MSISEKLKSARIEHKLSQKTVADALGVSRSTVSAFECDKAFPSVLYVRKFQELFNIPPENFNETDFFSKK